MQKTDIVYSDLKLEGATDKEERDSGLETSNLYRFWNDSDLRKHIKDKRNICLKTIRRHYIAEVEKRAIQKALNVTHWNRKKAAELLEVSYKTLLNRIEEFKLTP